MQIAHHFTTGEVAVWVSDCGGSYDVYADDSCEDFIGNACSISEAENLIADQAQE